MVYCKKIYQNLKTKSVPWLPCCHGNRFLCKICIFQNNCAINVFFKCHKMHIFCFFHRNMFYLHRLNKYVQHTSFYVVGYLFYFHGNQICFLPDIKKMCYFPAKRDKNRISNCTIVFKRKQQTAYLMWNIFLSHFLNP